MIRAFLRLLSMIALSVAVITSVLDATRSIAAETLVMTPLADTWEGLSPSTLDAFEALVRSSLPDAVWTNVAVPVLNVPAFAVFAALALALYVAGRRPAGRTGRFVLEN